MEPSHNLPKQYFPQKRKMQFEFINQDAGNRSLSKSDRCTIRSVSRRVGAATRREKGAVTRTNALQIPDFLAFEEESSTSSLTSSAPAPQPDQPLGVGTDPGSPDQTPALASSSRRHRESSARTTSLVGYVPNQQSVPPDVHIFMLPGLSAKLLARTASTDAHNNDIRWVKACRLGQESVLGPLPQRYGYRRCLDDAIDCVAGRMRLTLSPNDDRLAQLQIDRLYGRALRSLNVALSLGYVDWTVWYATVLLLLFELLENDHAHGWVRHSWGGFHVLLALGASQIVTETDKDLLVISAELMILEATFANVDCFLSRPEWQKALEATMICSENSRDRSEATVTLWMILARAPELFRKVTEIVAQQPSEAQNQLVDALRGLIDELSAWGTRWDMKLSYDSDAKRRSIFFPERPIGDVIFGQDT